MNQQTGGILADLATDLRSTDHRLEVEAGDATPENDDPDSDAGAFRAAGFQIEATTDGEAADFTDGLAGVIWAAGTHVPYVNGEPREIFVPEDTITPTFEDLQQKLQADGERPTIGFDHPDEQSVAAQTALGEIGEMQAVGLSADGREIVLKDSEFTNNKAVEAAEAGEFADYQFSIVGDIIPETRDGSVVRTDDGAIRIAATRVDRVDVVPDGAVDQADVADASALPQLAAARAAGRLAASTPKETAEGLVQSLRAAAGDTQTAPHAEHSEFMGDSDNPFPTDPENLEAAKGALSQAAETVEEKDAKIQNLQAEKTRLADSAEALREIAASQGVDPEEGEIEAQAVVDSFTEELREEIADLEASLPSYDVADTQSRVEDLAGNSVQDLEAMAGKRYRKLAQAEEKRSDLGSAVAASEQVEAGSGSDGGDEETEAIADSVLTPVEAMEADQNDQSASQFLEAKHGVDAAEFDSEHALNQAISAKNAEGN